MASSSSGSDFAELQSVPPREFCTTYTPAGITQRNMLDICIYGYTHTGTAALLLSF